MEDPGLPARVWGRAARTARRAAKYAAHVGRGRPGEAALLFVLGCQRSGTNMFLAVLEASGEAWTYNEDNPRAFRDFRLLDLDRIAALVDRSRFRCVAFKALCDSQHADRMLERFPAGKVVWPVRDYHAVAASAVRKWGEWQREMIRRLARDDGWDHWIAERVPPTRRELVREVFARDLSVNSAAALKWWLRNELFFDRGLDRTPDRALLVRYEDLVAEPEARFGEVFAFLGLRFEPGLVRNVAADPRPDESLPDLDDRVRELCDGLAGRLDRALEERRPRSAAL